MDAEPLKNIKKWPKNAQKSLKTPKYQQKYSIFTNIAAAGG